MFFQGKKNGKILKINRPTAKQVGHNHLLCKIFDNLIHIHIDIHIHVHIQIHIHHIDIIFSYSYFHTYIHTHIYTQIHISIFVHIYMYIYIHIYKNSFTCPSPLFQLSMPHNIICPSPLMSSVHPLMSPVCPF